MLRQHRVCLHCGAPLAAADGALGRCGYCGTALNPTPLRHDVRRPGLTVTLIAALIAASLAVLGGAFAVVLFLLNRPSTGAAQSSRAMHAPHLASARTTPSTAAAPYNPRPSTAALRASFVLDQRLDTALNSVWLLGRVKNESEVPIGKPKVRAVLKDAAAKDLSSFVGYPYRDRLAPGEVAPVMIVVTNPPAYSTAEFLVTATAFSSAQKPPCRLTVEALEPRIPPYSKNSIEVEGKVTNPGDTLVTFPRVEVELSDPDGKLVGLGIAYADDRELLPGATTRFQTRIVMARAHAKVAYAAWGNAK